jgi:DNA invertase Pin-like site-specific DNA recombinase
MADRDPQDQREFLSRRMREELARAEQAENEGLRQLHYSWATAYRRRLDALAGPGIRPKNRTGARGLGSWTTDLG